jgi:hypothetical protein
VEWSKDSGRWRRRLTGTNDLPLAESEQKSHPAARPRRERSSRIGRARPQDKAELMSAQDRRPATYFSAIQKSHFRSIAY